MVEKNEMHGNVPIFDMWNQRWFWRFFSEFFKGFSDKLFFLNSARPQIPLFANKKEGFSQNRAKVFTGIFNYCQSEYEAASVFFIHFYFSKQQK